MSIETLGWVVVAAGPRQPNGNNLEKVISKRFTIKTAAEEFAAIARKVGHAEVWIREVRGVEVDPMDRGRRRK